MICAIFMREKNWSNSAIFSQPKKKTKKTCSLMVYTLSCISKQLDSCLDLSLQAP